MDTLYLGKNPSCHRKSMEQVPSQSWTILDTGVILPQLIGFATIIGISPRIQGIVSRSLGHGCKNLRSQVTKKSRIMTALQVSLCSLHQEAEPLLSLLLRVSSMDGHLLEMMRWFGRM